MCIRDSAGAEFAVQGRFPDGDAEKTFSSDDTGVLFQDYVLLGSEDGERYLIPVSYTHLV